jgi:Ca2+-binding RTX toxin-like protein
MPSTRGSRRRSLNVAVTAFASAIPLVGAPPADAAMGEVGVYVPEFLGVNVFYESSGLDGNDTGADDVVTIRYSSGETAGQDRAIVDGHGAVLRPSESNPQGLSQCAFAVVQVHCVGVPHFIRGAEMYLRGGDDVGRLAGAGEIWTGVIDGGAGADTLIGSPGEDLLNGGDGDDLIRSDDGLFDFVSCGAGTDTVDSDPLDDVRDCENVNP